MRDLVAQDQKRSFRYNQIGEEGNDPLETGQSYGTPHDLASLYGKGRYEATQLPDGYDEKAPLGRPKEKVSNINISTIEKFADELFSTSIMTDKDKYMKFGNNYQ